MIQSEGDVRSVTYTVGEAWKIALAFILRHRRLCSEPCKLFGNVEMYF